MIDPSELKHYESTEYHLVYGKLIEAARYGGTATYQEIAQLAGLPLQGSYMGAEVGNIIGVISANEVCHGRPMLSAIVVGVSGLPGDGFYWWAEQLGRFDGSEDKEARLRFWEEEKQAVYKTWKREFKRA